MKQGLDMSTECGISKYATFKVQVKIFTLPTTCNGCGNSDISGGFFFSTSSSIGRAAAYAFKTAIYRFDSCLVDQIGLHSSQDNIRMRNVSAARKLVGRGGALCKSSGNTETVIGLIASPLLWNKYRCRKAGSISRHTALKSKASLGRAKAKRDQASYPTVYAVGKDYHRTFRCGGFCVSPRDCR